MKENQRIDALNIILKRITEINGTKESYGQFFNYSEHSCINIFYLV